MLALGGEAGTESTTHISASEQDAFATELIRSITDTNSSNSSSNSGAEFIVGVLINACACLHKNSFFFQPTGEQLVGKCLGYNSAQLTAVLVNKVQTCFMLFRIK